jgi:hypothetical protein
LASHVAGMEVARSKGLIVAEVNDLQA